MSLQEKSIYTYKTMLLSETWNFATIKTKLLGRNQALCTPKNVTVMQKFPETIRFFESSLVFPAVHSSFLVLDPCISLYFGMLSSVIHYRTLKVLFTLVLLSSPLQITALLATIFTSVKDIFNQFCVIFDNFRLLLVSFQVVLVQELFTFETSVQDRVL